MRFLLFLLLGTLIFGFAFPAFLLLVGLFALILLGVILFSAFSGRGVTVYTSKRNFDPFAGRKEERPADDPEVIGRVVYPDDAGVAEFGDDAEGEVVELPSSALRKEEDDG